MKIKKRDLFIVERITDGEWIDQSVFLTQDEAWDTAEKKVDDCGDALTDYRVVRFSRAVEMWLAKS